MSRGRSSSNFAPDPKVDRHGAHYLSIFCVFRETIDKSKFRKY